MGLLMPEGSQRRVTEALLRRRLARVVHHDHGII